MTKCAFCDDETPSLRTCGICSRPYCLEHQGTDGDFCQECSSDESTKIEVSTALPTTDPETGEVTEHEDVRVLHPVGEFYITTPGLIAKMSDPELERFYNRYSMLVKDREQALDRNRIILSMVSMEKRERDRHKIKVDKYAQPATKRIAKAVAAASDDRKYEILASLYKEKRHHEGKTTGTYRQRRKESQMESQPATPTSNSLASLARA